MNRQAVSLDLKNRLGFVLLLLYTIPIFQKGSEMPRPANPYTKVAKHLASLQAKAAKLNEEIAALAELVANETKKPNTETLKATSSAKSPKRVSSKDNSKKATKPKSKEPRVATTAKAKAKPISSSKPRTSKAKADQPASVDYLSMLNDEPSYPEPDKVVKPKRKKGEYDTLSMLNAERGSPKTKPRGKRK